MSGFCGELTYCICNSVQCTSVKQAPPASATTLVNDSFRITISFQVVSLLQQYTIYILLSSTGGAAVHVTHKGGGVVCGQHGVGEGWFRLQGGVDVRSRPCGVAAWLLDYVMLCYVMDMSGW